MNIERIYQIWLSSDYQPTLYTLEWCLLAAYHFAHFHPDFDSTAQLAFSIHLTELWRRLHLDTPVDPDALKDLLDNCE